MLKQLLLSLMLLGFAGVSAASVFEVTLDPAPYSRKLAREQAVDVLLARLAGSAAEASWVRDEIRENGARYREDEQTGGGYRVRFERGELLPLLESAGLKAWTGPRPSLLVWQVNGQRALDTMTTGWRRAGSDFAVPILWPLWDLQEHLQVNKDALQQNGALTEASRRYGAELWLAVQQRGGQLDWRLFSRDGEPPLAQGQAGDPAGVLAAVNDYWVTYQGVQRAPAPVNQAPAEALQAGAHAPGEYILVVTGLRHFADTVRLQQRLAALDGVSGVQLLDSAGDEVRLKLMLSGPAGAVQGLLAGAGLSALGEHRYRLAEAPR